MDSSLPRVSVIHCYVTVIDARPASHTHNAASAESTIGVSGDVTALLRANDQGSRGKPWPRSEEEIAQ